jgi:hypothetical protein
LQFGTEVEVEEFTINALSSGLRIAMELLLVRLPRMTPVQFPEASKAPIGLTPASLMPVRRTSVALTTVRYDFEAATAPIMVFAPPLTEGL